MFGQQLEAWGHRVCLLPFSITMVDGTHWLWWLMSSWDNLESPQRWAWEGRCIILIPLIDVGSPAHCGRWHSLAGILDCVSGEGELNSSMHSSLSVPQCRPEVAANSGSCLLDSPQHDGPYPQTMNRDKPFLKLHLSESFITATGKGTEAQVKDTAASGMCC